MCVEANQNLIDVEEVVEKLMDKADKPVQYEEFLKKIEEVCKNNLHGRHDTLKIGIQLGKDNNPVLSLFGVRKESCEEAKSRVAKEEAKKKFVKDQELKEYLRLKKIFEKKVEETPDE